MWIEMHSIPKVSDVTNLALCVKKLGTFDDTREKDATDTVLREAAHVLECNRTSEIHCLSVFENGIGGIHIERGLRNEYL